MFRKYLHEMTGGCLPHLLLRKFGSLCLYLTNAWKNLIFLSPSINQWIWLLCFQINSSAPNSYWCFFSSKIRCCRSSSEGQSVRTWSISLRTRCNCKGTYWKWDFLQLLRTVLVLLSLAQKLNLSPLLHPWTQELEIAHKQESSNNHEASNWNRLDLLIVELKQTREEDMRRGEWSDLASRIGENEVRGNLVYHS